MATRGISGSVRPFPKAGPLRDIGAVSAYVATLGEWTRQSFEALKAESRTIPSVAYADLPPLAGLVRLVNVPDDPTYGQVLCFNGVSTSGTDTGWYRLIPAGTAGAPAASFPAGGTTSQVLGKVSGTDYAMAWQTPYYVPSASGTVGQGLRKTTTAATGYAWDTFLEVSTGGSAGQALRKTGTAAADYAWADVHELTTGGTTSQVLAKVDGTDYNAAWVTLYGLPAGGADGQVLVKSGTGDGTATWGDNLGTKTAAALISEGILEAGTGSFARFSSTAAFLGAALELDGQTIDGTATGTVTQFLALTINGTSGHVPFITA